MTMKLGEKATLDITRWVLTFTITLDHSNNPIVTTHMASSKQCL
jgi:hypothetical protein